MRIEGELRKDLIWEQIDGQCIALKNSYKIGANKLGERFIVKSQAMKAYEKNFDRQCQIYRDRNISKPCKLHLVVYESSNAFDLDNSVSSVCDALQRNHVVVNDNLIHLLECRKVVDPAHPRICYAVEELEPSLF